MQKVNIVCCASVVEVDGLDADEEIVLHVVRIGQLRLAVRVGVPGMLVNGQRPLRHNGFDDGGHFAENFAVQSQKKENDKN